MATPNLKEIEWAIHELEQEESSFLNYAKLASLYTVKNALSAPAPKDERQIYEYSNSAMPQSEDKKMLYGDSEFLRLVSQVDPASAWAVMDELMETMRVVNKRVYDGVMRKLERIFAN